MDPTHYLGGENSLTWYNQGRIQTFWGMGLITRMRPLYHPDAHHDTHTNPRQVHWHISALKSTEPLYKYDQFKHVTHHHHHHISDIKRPVFAHSQCKLINELFKVQLAQYVMLYWLGMHQMQDLVSAEYWSFWRELVSAKPLIFFSTKHYACT